MKTQQLLKFLPLESDTIETLIFVFHQEGKTQKIEVKYTYYAFEISFFFEEKFNNNTSEKEYAPQTRKHFCTVKTTDLVQALGNFLASEELGFSFDEKLLTLTSEKTEKGVPIEQFVCANEFIPQCWAARLDKAFLLYAGSIALQSAKKAADDILKGVYIMFGDDNLRITSTNKQSLCSKDFPIEEVMITKNYDPNALDDVVIPSDAIAILNDAPDRRVEVMVDPYGDFTLRTPSMLVKGACIKGKYPQENITKKLHKSYGNLKFPISQNTIQELIKQLEKIDLLCNLQICSSGFFVGEESADYLVSNEFVSDRSYEFMVMAGLLKTALEQLSGESTMYFPTSKTQHLALTTKMSCFCLYGVLRSSLDKKLSTDSEPIQKDVSDDIVATEVCQNASQSDTSINSALKNAETAVAIASHNDLSIETEQTVEQASQLYAELNKTLTQAKQIHSENELEAISLKLQYLSGRYLEFSLRLQPIWQLGIKL